MVYGEPGKAQPVGPCDRVRRRPTLLYAMRAVPRDSLVEALVRVHARPYDTVEDGHRSRRPRPAALVGSIFRRRTDAVAGAGQGLAPFHGASWS